MIELDGIEYSLNTPEENCNDALSFINNYCAEHGAMNSKGEVIYVEPNTTNPLYIILYGLSYLVTIIQKLIYSVGASISIPHSSDNQLLNLADIANVRRRAPTKTTIKAFVTSNLPGEDAINCVITPVLSVTIATAEQDVVFHPATDYVIPPGEGRNITLIAEQEGSFAISAGSFSLFDTPVEGLRSIVASASEPGKDRETIAELRARIQRRASNGTQIDRAAEAIYQLDGVNNCNIYFNYSPTTPEVIGSGTHMMTVEPRKALVLVQGYSSEIAKTYFNHLLCESQQVTDSEVQYYVTKAGQQLPVYVTPPAQVRILIRLYLGEDAGYDQSLALKDTLLRLEGKITIGQDITAALVISQLREAYPTLSIIGAEVALEDGNFSFKTEIQQNEIAVFNTVDITIKGPSDEE